MAPILLFGFGIDLPTVVATDLLFATATKLVATALHKKNNFIDWQVAKQLWLGSIPASLAILSLAYCGVLFSDPGWITSILGTMILLSGASLLFEQRTERAKTSRGFLDPKRFNRYQAPTTSLCGVILGGLVASTSIGAGALGSIILRALYPTRMQPKLLVATDTTHAVPVTLISGIGYLLLGNTNLPLLALLLTGAIPAVIFSTSLLSKLPTKIIRISLGIILICTSIKLIIF